MKRRDVLKQAVAVGVGASLAGTLPACLPSVRVEDGRPMPEDMNAFLAAFDQGMAEIDRSTFVAGFVTRMRKDAPPPPEEVARREDLFRRMLRSLFVTTSLRDLPIEGQLDEGVQLRMRAQAGEVDQTVADVTEMLASLSAQERGAVRDHLKEKPGLAMRLAEAVDTRAAAVGLPKKRRRQFRAMMTQAAFRLRHAAPEVLIDEYVEKSRRVQEQAPGDLEMRRVLVAQIGEAAFWQLEARYAAMDAQAPPPVAAPGPAPAPSATPTSSQPTAGAGAMRGGLWSMGIGAVIFGISALILNAGASDVLLLGLTVGAVLFAIGLIVLLVGLLVSAASR